MSTSATTYDKYIRDSKRIRARNDRGTKRLDEFHHLGSQLSLDRENRFARELLVKIMADVPDEHWTKAIESMKSDYDIS